MKMKLIVLLLPLIIAGCTGGKVHDTQMHRDCSRGANNINSSVNKHLECMDAAEKSK
jgi:hypothetical protein